MDALLAQHVSAPTRSHAGLASARHTGRRPTRRVGLASARRAGASPWILVAAIAIALGHTTAAWSEPGPVIDPSGSTPVADPAQAAPRADPDNPPPVADPAQAALAPPPHPIVHIPVPETIPGIPLRIHAIVADTWSDAALLARYRPLGTNSAYIDIPFERSSTGDYVAVVPATDVVEPGIAYYIVGVTRDGTDREYLATAQRPLPIRVETSSQDRWIAAERDRLQHRLHVLEVRTDYLNFGAHKDLGVSTTDATDAYLRTEIGLRHLQVATVYSFFLGFGRIAGDTPSGDDLSTSTQNEVRYGFGGAELRVSDRVWVESRAFLGYGDDGAIVGLGSQLTLGRPWRSAVQIGAELLGQMGGRAWFRLQWDTVPPLLMAAQVTRDSFADAAIAGGSSVSLEATYPMARGLRLGAGIHYASRGRRVGFVGGSAQLSYAF